MIIIIINIIIITIIIMIIVIIIIITSKAARPLYALKRDYNNRKHMKIWESDLFNG